MFERFTKRAACVVAAAVEVARDAGSAEARPEHLLEAILAEGGGVAVAVLTELGAAPDEMRASCTAPGRGDPVTWTRATRRRSRCSASTSTRWSAGSTQDLGGARPRRGHLPFAKAARSRWSSRCARRCGLGDGFIGTEHLLLGLVRSGDPVVRDALAAFDVDPDALRAAVAATERRRTG